MLEKALLYAGMGWRPVPLHGLKRDAAGVVVGCTCGNRNGCDPAGGGKLPWGKHPIGNEWQRTASSEPERVRAAWKETPWAQVGVATGPESGIWVLDVDGEVGRASLDAWTAENGPLPETWTVQTGSGGLQLYFLWPDNLGERTLGNRAGVAPGIDVRGVGGQVVAPPSENRNGVYSVLNADEPVDAPAWLLDRVVRTPPKRSVWTPGQDTTITDRRLRSFIDACCRKVALTGQGGRNSALFAATRRVAEVVAAHGGASPDEAKADLQRAGESCGLNPREVSQAIGSGWHYGWANPVPLEDRESMRPVRVPSRPVAQPEPVEPETEQESPQEIPAASDGVGELVELYHAATAEGANRAELVARLVDLQPRLVGNGEAVAVLRKLRAVRGFATEVDTILKARPVLQVVKGGGGGKPPADDGGGSAGGGAGRGRPDGLPVGWIDPAGFLLTRGGVFRLVDRGDEVMEVLVCRQPIWIAERWQDVDHDEQQVRIQWPGGSAVVGRAVAMASRELVQLAGRGAPVSSANAAGVVEWLEASENRNREVIPVRSSIGRVGWTMAEGSPALQGVEGPHLLRAEEGHEQTANALKVRGRLQDWKRAAAEVHKNAVPALLLAAAVGSLTLEHTGAFPFVIDLHGHTSRGKTTALRWAASAWADPTDAGAFILPWSATNAAIEARAGFLRDLPLCLDDTKKVQPKERERLASVVYQWGSGQGKARGRPDGARRLTTWRSVLISTGEAPLARLAGEHAGLRMRVLSISDQPFAGVAGVNAVEGLTAWGHIGPEAAKLVAMRHRVLRKQWQEKQQECHTSIGGSPSGSRLAGYMATVLLGVQLLIDLGVPMPADEITSILKRSARVALDGADVVGEARDKFVAWLAANADKLTRPNENRQAPAGGWIGAYDTDATVVLVPSVVDGELRRLGYDPEEILPQWAIRSTEQAMDADGKPVDCKAVAPGDCKWVVSAKDGGLKHVIWWLKKSVRMYKVGGLVGWASDESAESKKDKS